MSAAHRRQHLRGTTTACGPRHTPPDMPPRKHWSRASSNRSRGPEVQSAVPTSVVSVGPPPVPSALRPIAPTGTATCIPTLNHTRAAPQLPRCFTTARCRPVAQKAQSLGTHLLTPRADRESSGRMPSSNGLRRTSISVEHWRRRSTRDGRHLEGMVNSTSPFSAYQLFLSTTRPNRVATINGQPQKHYMHYGPEKNIRLFFLVL